MSSNNNHSNKIISKAIRLTSAVDAHLSEGDCHHTIKEIAKEAFEEDGKNICHWVRAQQQLLQERPIRPQEMRYQNG